MHVVKKQFIWSADGIESKSLSPGDMHDFGACAQGLIDAQYIREAEPDTTGRTSAAAVDGSSSASVTVVDATGGASAPVSDVSSADDNVTTTTTARRRRAAS